MNWRYYIIGIIPSLHTGLDEVPRVILIIQTPLYIQLDFTWLVTAVKATALELSREVIPRTEQKTAFYIRSNTSEQWKWQAKYKAQHVNSETRSHFRIMYSLHSSYCCKIKKFWGIFRGNNRSEMSSSWCRITAKPIKKSCSRPSACPTTNLLFLLHPL